MTALDLNQFMITILLSKLKAQFDSSTQRDAAEVIEILWKERVEKVLEKL